MARETTKKSTRRKKPTEFLQYDHLMTAYKIRRSRKKKEKKIKKREADKKLWARKKMKASKKN